jgi:uncharacterized protein YgiM (DUF1202 family)
MSKILHPLVILLFTIVTPTAFSEADGPDYWKVYGVESGDVLNIRLEANWNSEKVGEIPSNGQCLKNLRCVGGLTYAEFTNLSQAEKEKIEKERPRWCQIEYKGIKGWVAGRFLREGTCQKDSN